MTSEEGLLVHALHIARHGIEALVAVHETVRHNQVDHILCGETFPLRRAFATGGNLVRDLERLAVLREYQIIGAGSRGTAHVHVNEQIVWTVGLVDGLDIDTAVTLEGDVVRGDFRALDQKLERGFHSHPPAERFYTVDLVTGSIRNAVRIETAGASGDCKGCCSHKVYLFHIYCIT